MTRLALIVLTALLFAYAGPAAHAEIRLIAAVSIPGTARDLSGLTAPIGPDQPHDLLGGFGSAIAYTGKGDLYWAATDRGPFDGGAPYRCRVHKFRFTIVPREAAAPGRVDWSLVSTVLLCDDSGAPLMGGSGYFNTATPSRSTRFDPEGVRLSRSGDSLFISDEYGPFIDEFSLDGKRLRRLPVPSALAIEHPASNAADELPPRNTSGRQPNRGLEGLAITPDGATLWAIPQSPLMQDGALNHDNGRTGVNIRTLRIDTATGKSGEFIYTLDEPSLGISEMLAVDDRRFLVLERDGRPGADAKFKRIVLADFSGATDISAIKGLPAAGLPKGAIGASKALFIDLLDPQFGLAGGSMPEKIEGLTFGPDLPDGRHTLLVATDNDLNPAQPTLLWFFAFNNSDLPGFTPQQFQFEPRVDTDGRGSGQKQSTP